MSKLRIFIADSNKNGRLGLQMLLDHQPGMKIVGISVQEKGFIEQIAAVVPDVVLIDWKLVKSASTKLIKNIHSYKPHPQIIVLDVDPETQSQALASGADEFISKDIPPDQLLLVLQKIKQNKLEEIVNSDEATADDTDDKN